MNEAKYAILGVITGLVLGFLFGLTVMEDWLKDSAIKNNAAEYQVDKATGEVKFIWLTSPAK